MAFFFGEHLRLCPWSLALSIPVLGVERVCPRKGCSWPWPRIFLWPWPRALCPLLHLCYKLPANLIFGELVEKGLSWNTVNLPVEAKERWHRWLKHLDRLKNSTLPRFHFNLHKAKPVELHGFADASKVGYSITYNLRVHDGKNVYLSYISGKSKVLPLICTTTPRAELHAA